MDQTTLKLFGKKIALYGVSDTTTILFNSSLISIITVGEVRHEGVK